MCLYVFMFRIQSKQAVFGVRCPSINNVQYQTMLCFPSNFVSIIFYLESKIHQWMHPCSQVIESFTISVQVVWILKLYPVLQIGEKSKNKTKSFYFIFVTWHITPACLNNCTRRCFVFSSKCEYNCLPRKVKTLMNAPMLLGNISF